MKGKHGSGHFITILSVQELRMDSEWKSFSNTVHHAVGSYQTPFSYRVSIGPPVPSTGPCICQALYKYLLDILKSEHQRYKQWFYLGGNLAMENSGANHHLALE